MQHHSINFFAYQSYKFIESFLKPAPCLEFLNTYIVHNNLIKIFIFNTLRIFQNWK